MNQYRCETCKHYHDETEDTYGMCYAEKAHREQLYNNVYDHLARYGCASHSDFQAEREKVLEALKKDLRTRFIPSNNQWSKGRNSGLIECCNIIDEELRRSKDGEL